MMLDIIKKDGKCSGIILADKDQNIRSLYSDYVVLATGGIGGLYENSTNFAHITGDAIGIALKNNIELKDVHYIQIHPTTLYSKKPGRRFLISESVRGEGALLYNKNKERFVDELLPRDILTKEIFEQMEKEQSEFVWLSMKEMGEERIKKRFPNIYRKCLEEGYNITKEMIPVVPAQHYYMGGIRVDENSETSMKHLYAIGETSCNGVHGANRLASNSLLESLVFAKRSALHVTKNYEKITFSDKNIFIMEEYSDLKKLEEKSKDLIMTEIERSLNK
jgi:L-aspartate oxidase